MSQKNESKPRTCSVCGEDQYCTAAEIKEHAALCQARKLKGKDEQHA